MIRKQVYIDEETLRSLKTMSILKKCSEAALIRDAIRHYAEHSTEEKSMNPLLRIAGLCEEGSVDSSVEHDKYLYEGYGE
jgi:hypothetical protein